MASRRQQAREETRAKILGAAIELFAEVGYHGARTADLARRAGVAEGTIYLHFPSKDDLLEAAVRHTMVELLARFQAILDETQDPLERVARYVVAHLELARARPATMQILTVELRRSTKYVRVGAPAPPGFTRYLALLAQVIEDGQRRGVFRAEGRPLFLARALFGALDEIALSVVLASGAAPDVEALGRSMVALWLGALGAVADGGQSR